MFIANNRASFHLWRKENLVKHQKVSKYYENDCSCGLSKLTSSRKNIFCMNFVREYYLALNILSDSSFKLQLTNKKEVFKILINVDPEEACGLDEIPCRKLKDGSEILAEPISQIVNMSLGSKFPEGCKTVKVRSIFKKGKKKNQKITDLFHFRLYCLKLLKE